MYYTITLDGKLATPTNFPDFLDHYHGRYVSFDERELAERSAHWLREKLARDGVNGVVDVAESQELVLTHYTIEINGSTEIGDYHNELSGELTTTEWHSISDWLDWLFGLWRVPNRVKTGVEYTIGQDRLRILACDKVPAKEDVDCPAEMAIIKRHQRVSAKLQQLSETIDTLAAEIRDEYMVRGENAETNRATRTLMELADGNERVLMRERKRQSELVDFVTSIQATLVELAGTVAWMPSEIC